MVYLIGVKVDIYDVIEVIETIEWNTVMSYYRHTVGHQHTYRRPKYIKKDVSIRNYIGHLINNRCDLNGNHYYNIIYHIFINYLLFIYLCMPDFRLYESSFQLLSARRKNQCLKSCV